MKTLLLCSLLLLTSCTVRTESVKIPIVYTSSWHEEVKAEIISQCKKESEDIALALTGAKIAQGELATELQTREDVVYYYSVINKLLMDSCLKYHKLDI